MTIKTQNIKFENTLSILGQIKGIAKTVI